MFNWNIRNHRNWNYNTYSNCTPLFKPFDKMLGTFYLYQNIFATTVTASDQYMSIQLLEGKSLADKSFEFVLDWNTRALKITSWTISLTVFGIGSNLILNTIYWELPEFLSNKHFNANNGMHFPSWFQRSNLLDFDHMSFWFSLINCWLKKYFASVPSLRKEFLSNKYFNATKLIPKFKLFRLWSHEHLVLFHQEYFAGSLSKKLLHRFKKYTKIIETFLEALCPLDCWIFLLANKHSKKPVKFSKKSVDLGL